MIYFCFIMYYSRRTAFRLISKNEPKFCRFFAQSSFKKSTFLRTVHFGLTCNCKFHNIGCFISQCGLKGFFALFWCDHVLRLVFIVKLPFCTLSTFARTVCMTGWGWLALGYINTYALFERGGWKSMAMRWKPVWSNFTKAPSKS